MARHDAHEGADFEHKGVQPISISTNPEMFLDNLYVTKRPRKGLNSHDLSLSRTVQPPQHSVSSPLPLRTRRTPVGPADTSCDEIVRGLAELALSPAHDQSCAIRMGRGTAAGKDLDISLKSSSHSLIPRATPKREMPPPLIPVPKTPTRSRTPMTPYLNKYTNERCPVFDDTRVASLEAQFNAFKEQMEGDMQKQNNLKESMKLYEKRSKLTLSVLSFGNRLSPVQKRSLTETI